MLVVTVAGAWLRPRAWMISLGAAVALIALVAPGVAGAATRYVSASGVDGGACATLSSACRSFNYAYRQAGAGDVVEVAGGTYAAQSIPKVAGRSAPPVEFGPAAGAQVTLGDLDINGDQVTVRGMRSSSEVSVTNALSVNVIDMHATKVWMQNAHGVVFRGGSYGGNQNSPTVQIAGDPASSNLTFDGVDFHDAVATNSTVHMECIWIAGVDGFTVRNSIFRNCAYFDIFFTRLNGPDPKNVLLENNVFEVTKQWTGQNAPYAVNVANWLSRVENFTFRNNSFGGDIAIQPTTIVNMRLNGNVGAVASCKGGVNYSYNVWTGAKCATSDKQVAVAMSQFVNPAGHDWRLRSGAAAIDSANPSDYPPTDRAGLGRNGLPDAGAHEYDGGGAPPADTQPPSAPGGLSAPGGVEQVVLSWGAASDNVGVARYNVHRSTSSGFTPSSSNRVAQVTGTGYTDAGLAPGTYHYRVTAEDSAGNVGAATAQASGVASAEQTPPTVSLSAPAAGATVVGTVSTSASASDNRGVAGVQFRVDGENLGAEDTTAPYSVSWNTTSASDGSHTLTAVASDAAGNSATSAPRSVTVDNVPAADTQPPGAPGDLTAMGGQQQVGLSWLATSDDVGVASYNVHRSILPGVTPSSGNRVAQVSGTSHTDSNLLPGAYYYRVTAQDAAGNVGSASNEASAAASPGLPSAGISAPAPVEVSDEPAPPSPGKKKRRRLMALGEGSPGSDGTAAPVLTLIGEARGRACESRRPRCPRLAQLRLNSSVTGRLRIAVELVGARGHARRVKVAQRRARKGVNLLRVSGRGWRRGRYRMSIRAVDAKGRTSNVVRVRFTVRSRKGAAVLRLRG